MAFCRLVDSFQNDPPKLMEIASPELLTNLQQLVSFDFLLHIFLKISFMLLLIYFKNFINIMSTKFELQLVESPPVISTSTFISVLRMLTIMCSACPELALTLLKQNIADTLCYLFTGSAEKNTHFEVSRNIKK